MNHPNASTLDTVSPQTRSEQSGGLSGYWLVLARFLWVILVALALAIFIASLPDYFTHLQTLCRVALCAPASGQLTPGSAQALHNLGITLGGYAIYTLALEVATALIWFAISAVCSLKLCGLL